MSWDTASRIDIQRLKKLLQPGLANVRRLGIDEVYLGKQHKFVTLVVHLDTWAVISVAPGRGLGCPQGILLRLKRAGAKIHAVAMDMSGDTHRRELLPDSPVHISPQQCQRIERVPPADASLSQRDPR